MGNSIQIASARFDSDKVVTSLTLPSLVGLDMEYLLGTNATRSTRNRVNPAAGATVVGAPVYDSSLPFVTVDSTAGNSGFNTGLSADATGNTFIALARINAVGTNTSSAFFFGKFGSHGLCFAPSFPGSLEYANGLFTGVGNRARLAIPAVGTTPFVFVCGRGLVGSLGKLSFGNADVLTTATASALDGAYSSGALSIGTDKDVNESGTTQMCYAAHYNRVLSDAEIASAYMSLKAYFTPLGLTVA